jgi:hypothetical protein
MSKILDLYNSFNGAGLQNDWTKAKKPSSKDQTPYSIGTIPGKDVKAPFGNVDPSSVTETKLKEGRSGELGSNPKPLPGYNMPGYGPGDKQYTKLVQK